MANTKIHINVTQGLIEAEGDEAFVLKVYEDFKKLLGKETIVQRGAAQDGAEGTYDPPPPKKNQKPQRRGRARRSSTEDTSEEGQGVSNYKPARDNSLDLSKLKDFAAPFKTKNAGEKILVYAQFLREKLGIDPCTVDQIFTCFQYMKDKTPQAFGQAFITTRGRYGYIEFKGVQDIKITIAGDNYFNHDIERVK